MKDLVFITVFLFVGLLSWSQSAHEEKATNTSSKKVSLEKKMNFKVLKAFQNNSKSKVNDLFNYFQLLTDATVDDELKKEVIKTIEQFYKNEYTQVIDFTSESRELIPLKQFLQKLLISEPILFSVSEETNFNSVTENSWNTSYIVSRTKSGITSKIKVNQLVYFIDEMKQFGTLNKPVQSTYLGEME